MKNNLTKLVPLLFACLCLSHYQTKGQLQIDSTDTVYVFFLKGSLTNGRPKVDLFILNNINDLTSISNRETEDSFLCDFSKIAVLFDDPYLSIEKNYHLCDFEKGFDKNVFMKEQLKKIDDMIKNFFRIGKKKFTVGNPIAFDCVKITGDFWRMDTAKVKLNHRTSGFTIDKNCYNKIYQYQLKHIHSIIPLTQGEVSKIAAYLQVFAIKPQE